MKRRLPAALCVAAAAAVVGIPQAGGRTSAVNLAPDPGFESDPTASYYTWGPATYSWATDAAHSGTHSLKIVSGQPPGTLTRWMSETQAIAATPGTVYTASAYLKTASSGGIPTANLSIDFWDVKGSYLGVTADSAKLVATNDWTYVFVSRKAPPKAAYVRIEFRLSGSGILWADDAGLTTDTGAPAPPEITGSPRQGQILTTTLGTWPPGATLFQIYWQRCDASGSACTGWIDNLGGEEATYPATYVLSSADVGSRIRTEVQMVIDGQLATADSAPTAVVTAVDGLPVATAAPEISGPTAPDRTMSASTGTWTGSPTAYSYQWYECVSDVQHCDPIAGETAATIHLPWDSDTRLLRVAVVATNGAGSTRSVSPRARYLADFVVYEPPTIHGPTGNQPSFTVGSTLIAFDPTWTGAAPWNHASEPSFWLRCDTSGRNCSDVGGGSYVLTAADVGHRMRVVVEELDARLTTGVSIGAASEPSPVVTSG